MCLSIWKIDEACFQSKHRFGIVPQHLPEDKTAEQNPAHPMVSWRLRQGVPDPSPISRSLFGTQDLDDHLSGVFFHGASSNIQ